MGYVWCDGYVWDMCGVRYANNLLKKPATKRLSGKNGRHQMAKGKTPNGKAQKNARKKGARSATVGPSRKRVKAEPNPDPPDGGDDGADWGGSECSYTYETDPEAEEGEGGEGERGPESEVATADPVVSVTSAAKLDWPGKRLSHKGIGFLGEPPEMIASFASALADETAFSQLDASGPDPFPLLAALTMQVLPSSCHPTTVFAAEGLVPTAGVLLHLILPHSLRCPADAYLTQVAMHYPHLHRSDGQEVAYGHHEEPPFFFLAGCGRSLGYRQSMIKRRQNSKCN